MKDPLGVSPSIFGYIVAKKLLERQRNSYKINTLRKSLKLTSFGSRVSFES